MAQARLSNVEPSLVEVSEILYTTTYVNAWACRAYGEDAGKIIAESIIDQEEGREDGMGAGDLGMLVYDIVHKRVEVNIVDEPVCLALADALTGARPRFPRWLNPKFLAMLARGEEWFDDLPNQTFSAELVARIESERN